jgi:hypothetical protein
MHSLIKEFSDEEEALERRRPEKLKFHEMSLRMKQRAPSNFITERDIAEEEEEEEELMRCCTERFQRVSANFCWRFCQFHSIFRFRERKRRRRRERKWLNLKDTFVLFFY